VFSVELFGTRTFQNGRHVGAVMGLVPVRDQRVHDQGISRAGRAEVRRIALQLAWGWVRWQPASALTQWFLRRFSPAGGRSQRIGIVAVARKLAIALWRYVEHGVMPEGATLKASRQPRDRRHGFAAPCRACIHGRRAARESCGFPGNGDRLIV
jgi:transposase